MSYNFEPGRIYRMPTHFGPTPGPRQWPDANGRDWKHSARTLTVSASFLTDAARLDRHLPEGFTLIGEPVVTVDFHYMSCHIASFNQPIASVEDAKLAISRKGRPYQGVLARRIRSTSRKPATEATAHRVTMER